MFENPGDHFVEIQDKLRREMVDGLLERVPAELHQPIDDPVSL